MTTFSGHVRLCRRKFENNYKFGDIYQLATFTTWEEYDVFRLEHLAFQYLVHLEQAKRWMEAILYEELPAVTDFEEALRNGVYLAKVANVISPDYMPISRIYDCDQKRYKLNGLQYRHVDNIHHWVGWLNSVRLPKQFQPEANDIYNRKNMPLAIYSLHALSIHLGCLGKAPLITNLKNPITNLRYSVTDFTDDQIDSKREELKKYGISGMPAFQKIGALLTNEMPIDKVALHNVLIAINEALESEDMRKLLTALQNPSACFMKSLINTHVEQYYSAMLKAKHSKMKTIQIRKDLDDTYTPDEHDIFLTHYELQEQISSVNVMEACKTVQNAVNAKDENVLFKALQSAVLDLKFVKEKCISLYMKQLSDCFENEATIKRMESWQRRLLLQRAISEANKEPLKYTKKLNHTYQPSSPRSV